MQEMTVTGGAGSQHVLKMALILAISFLLTSVGTVHAATGGEKISLSVEGEITETTCELSLSTNGDEGEEVVNLDFSNIQTSSLKPGGLVGMQKITVELQHCSGAVNDDKYNKVVGVTFEDQGGISSDYIFRTVGGGDGIQQNNADASVGFAITTKDPSGTTMAWSTADLVKKGGLVDLGAGKKAGPFHNGFDNDNPVSVSFWIGMSCGSQGDCDALNETAGGSLKSDMTLTFGYK